MTSPISGDEDIRERLKNAEVLAFPHLEASDGYGGVNQSGDGTPSKPDRPSMHPLTDLGNAERFIDRCARLLCFCPALGWLAWDGTRWNREGADEAVARAAWDTVRAIQDEAEAIRIAPGVDFVIKDETKSKPAVFYSDALKVWGRTSETSHRLTAIPRLAASRMTVGVEAFDRDPMKINVLNGTLVVSREIAKGYVRLDAHDPGDYITRLAPVVYDPDAAGPQFDAFLNEIQPPTVDAEGHARKDAQHFLMAWFGYSLTGATTEQKMVFLYGKGRNGKGVLVNIAAWIAGDYADQIPIESFLDSGRARAGGQATPDIAGLPGVRMLGTSEPKKGSTLDEAFVKLFTGGDRIKARHLNKDFFTFTPHAKLTMQGNYRPKISGSDEGIWARVVLVPCLVFIPPEQRDPKLLDKLKAEGSGVLNRLLDGLRDWLDYGLVLPDSVAEATKRYREDSDPLGRFLTECTRQRVGARVSATAMHVLFLAWTKAAGESEWTIKGLGSALKERGLSSKRSKGSQWVDIELTKTVMDFEVDASTE